MEINTILFEGQQEVFFWGKVQRSASGYLGSADTKKSLVAASSAPLFPPRLDFDNPP